MDYCENYSVRIVCLIPLVQNHTIQFWDIGEDGLYAEENVIRESF